VPISGSSTDDEAVRLACRLARRQAGRVYVITILEVKRSLALDAAADVEVQRCEALLDHAELREWRADLLVLGMPFRERFGEFFMGKTAPYVLKYAACRTLVFREPLEPE